MTQLRVVVIVVVIVVIVIQGQRRSIGVRDGAFVFGWLWFFHQFVVVLSFLGFVAAVRIARISSA